MNPSEEQCNTLAHALMVLGKKLRDPQIGPCLLAINESSMIEMAYYVKELLELIKKYDLPQDLNTIDEWLWPDVIE